jgi:hypothetical protein
MPPSTAERNLLTIALGVNALSPPGGDRRYAVERASVAAVVRALAALAAGGQRLLRSRFAKYKSCSAAQRSRRSLLGARLHASMS